MLTKIPKNIPCNKDIPIHADGLIRDIKPKLRMNLTEDDTNAYFFDAAYVFSNLGFLVTDSTTVNTATLNVISDLITRAIVELSKAAVFSLVYDKNNIEKYFNEKINKFNKQLKYIQENRLIDNNDICIKFRDNLENIISKIDASLSARYAAKLIIIKGYHILAGVIMSLRDVRRLNKPELINIGPKISYLPQFILEKIFFHIINNVWIYFMISTGNARLEALIGLTEYYTPSLIAKDNPKTSNEDCLEGDETCRITY